MNLGDEHYIGFKKLDIWSDEKITKYNLLNFISQAVLKIDIVENSVSPIFYNNVEIKEKLFALKKRGIFTRFVTKITKENIEYCKDLTKYVELRHSDRIKCNMLISGNECVTTTLLYDGPKTMFQTIYTDTKDVIEQKLNLFERVWDDSIPFEQKIYEMNKGLMGGVFNVVHDYNKIMKMINDLVESCSKEIQLLLPNDESIIFF